jgi:hypothetical protein
MKDIFTKILGFDLKYKRGFVLCFILGFVVRLIPEIISYPHPIGFDTVGYAAIIGKGTVRHRLSSMFSTWLFYAILTPIYEITKIDPFLLVKLAAPILYALNVCGIYYFSSKTLGWEPKKSFFAAFLFTFQLASLRVSWDLYRNILGMAMILFTLPWIREIETKKGFFCFVLLSILSVFSHEYTSVIMLFTVLSLMVKDFLKGERARGFKISAAIFPALVIFLIIVIGSSQIFYSLPLYAGDNVINTTQPISHPGNLFFLVNYLKISSPIENYPTYIHLISHVFSLFALLYLIYTPLILTGFFRNKILDSWTMLLIVGSFNSVIMPFFALDLWNRWMFLLVYPFTFYIANGVEKVVKSRDIELSRIRGVKVSKRAVSGILVSTVLLGLVFTSTPLFYGKSGVFSIPTTYLYFPSSMLHNTIPLQDVEGTVESINWLNENMTSNSCVLVHHAFLPWTSIHLDEEYTIIYYVREVEKALNVALEEQEFNTVYIVWWNENIGWYDINIPEHFKQIFYSDRISVFKYET